MEKYKIVHRGYFYSGIIVFLICLFSILLDYLSHGRCVSGGRLGTQLCGNDKYTYDFLMMIFSLILIKGGVGKIKE
ncbi:MAG: hypothetical protein PHY93_19590 [Bacteriovorax sp.]|nr:hypothetical protein [Bacteriovorax sp.]